MTAKVVTGLSGNRAIAAEILEKAGIELVRLSLVTEEDIVGNTADADAVLAGPNEPYTKKVLRSMTKCKVISRVGIGFDNVDAQEATVLGIPVAVVLDASIHEVSDHALAFILAFSRKLHPLAQSVRAGAWKPDGKEITAARGNMFRLNQQTLGLVGMGKIGKLVVQKARAFGMRVVVCDPYLSSEDVQKDGAELVDFDYVLRNSDFVSLHAPLIPETQKLFGLKEFRKMKPTAYIINASRGGLIDEQALYQAITEGVIAGAGLDVTDPEPPQPDNPLLKLEQVMITGHSAWFSESSVLDLQRRSTESIVLALKGLAPPYLANPEVLQHANCRIGNVASEGSNGVR